MRTTKKAARTTKEVFVRQKVSDKEFLKTLISYTDLALKGSNPGDNKWLEHQIVRLKKELKTLK